ncbi:MAG TPA: EAL domain-containing protein, partial [Gammaproteobacteria bacterium]|nr:EAL domain-containing protein [Gammaproteobacteria bacterium]
FGYSPAELAGGTTRVLHPGEDQFQAFGERSEATMLSPRNLYHAHLWMQRRDGSAFPSENLVHLITDDEGRPFAGLSVVRDLSEAGQGQVPPEEFGASGMQGISGHLPGAVFQRVRTADGEIRNTYLAGDLVRTLAPEAAGGVDPGRLFECLHPADRPIVETELKHAGRRLATVELDARLLPPGGDLVWLRILAQPHRLDDGSTVWDGCALDITREREAQELARYLASHDALTGLPNRIEFVEALGRLLGEADSDRDRLAVAHLDVHRMMALNEARGAAMGDEVLCQAAHRLEQVLGPGEMAGRAYSDVFLAMLRVPPGEAGSAEALARLQAVFREPFVLSGGETVTLDMSLGIALFPDNGDAAELLIGESNTALDRAKRQPELSYAFYQEDLGARLQGRFTREQALREAIDGGILEPFYQPQVSLADGSLIGFEALVRWPEGDAPVPPGEFVPLAEEVGLIGSLETLVLARVAGQVTAWAGEGLTVPVVAVNTSAKQLHQGGFANRFRRSLEAAGAEPGRIGLEITESSLLEDFEATRAALEDLAGRGVKLAIDDFGTGFSSLSRLVHLPLHMLKIDRSFVRAIESDARQRSIIEGLIPMAQALGMAVMAEGVETRAQADWLRSRGCDGAQGFLYGPALPAAEARAWLTPSG